MKKQRKWFKQKKVILMMVAVLICGNLLHISAKAEENVDICSFPEAMINEDIKSITPSFPGEGELPDVTVRGNNISEFSVYRVQQGTAPGSHYSIIFMGDGYTADMQEAYILDVKAKTAAFFNFYPMSYFKDRFDVYAIKVVSENVDNNTYFGIGSKLNNGAATNTKPIANFLKSQLISELGLKASDVYETAIVSNHTWGGGVAVSGHLVIGKGAHNVFVHESGHAGNRLTDEYWMASRTGKVNRASIQSIAKDGLTASEIAGLSMYDYDKLDLSKILWSSYLGYRNVYVDSFDDVNEKSVREFRPNHKACMMGNAGAPFCAVCEAQVFSQLNAYFNYPDEVFVPVPEFSYNTTDTPIYYCNRPSSSKYFSQEKTYYPSAGIGAPAPEFVRFTNLSDIDTDAEKAIVNHDLAFRTVVCAYQKPADLKMKVTVFDENGQIKIEREKDFLVNSIYDTNKFAAQTAVSLQLTIQQNEWEAAIGTSSSNLNHYKIVGEIIDNITGEVLKSTEVQ